MKKKLLDCFNKILDLRYTELIMIVIFKIILDFTFLVFMKDSSNYNYSSDFNIYKCIISDLAIILLYILINNIKQYTIRFFTKIIFLLMFVPISTLYMAKNYDTKWYLLIILEILIVIYATRLLKLFANVNFIKKTKNLFDNKLNFKMITKIIYIAFIANTFLVLILCLYYNGIPTLEAFNFREVYEIRDQFYLPKLINYLYTFELKFILPFLIILYLHKKSYIRLCVAILIQVIFFLIKADKITLFCIPLIIVVYLMFKFFKAKKVEKTIPLLFILACAISILTYSFLPMILALFVTRLLIVPANLKFVYFDFFTNNPKIGIVGTLINVVLKMENPYTEMPYQNLIGGIYFNQYTMYSNTGVLAEGYARFGYIGFVIIPFIISIVLYVINYGSRKNGIPFTMAIAIFPLMNLNDGDILSSLLFGGVLSLMIVCVCFRVDSLNIKESEIRAKFKNMQ